VLDHQKFIHIKDDIQFAELCDSLKDSSVIGLDTEFVRETSYYPVFCLLQISFGSNIACIDPLSLSSMELLRGVLLNPATLKVLHSCRQDIEVLFHHFGEIPINIHDTQIAAALAGIAEHIGYSNLTEYLLGIHLNKDETRTDWSARPLTSRQLRYAADDVAYLQPSHQLLTSTLKRHGRLDWLDEDCNSILCPELYIVDPINAWRRFKGTRKLHDSQINRLRTIAEWREKVAQTANIPRTWVMKDEFVYILAKDTRIQLSSIPIIRGLKSKDQKKHVENLMDLLNQSDSCIMSDTHSYGELPDETDTRKKTLLKTMSSHIKQRSSELGISPSILATRADLEDLMELPTRGRLISGWRYEVIGRSLQGFIN
jgi:ribonuclease D